MIAEEKRHGNAKTERKYQRKPAATPQVTTTFDPKEILLELCSESECLLLDMKFYFSFTEILDPDPRWDLSLVLRKIGRIDPRWDLSCGLRKIIRNDPRWDLSFVLGEIRKKDDPRWDLSCVSEHVRKNHQLKVLAPHEGGAPFQLPNHRNSKIKLPEPHQEGETSYPTLVLIHRNLYVPQGEFETIRE